MSEDDRSFGTAAPDAPVPRADFERALRHLNLSDLELRDAVFMLGARLVALTDELTRRLDGLEPEPAPSGTRAPPPTQPLEVAVMAQVGDVLERIRMADAHGMGRVQLEGGADKYQVESSDLPCGELMPLCHARCCTFNFALSSQDLEEGVIRWDHGQPYLIRQRASDHYCVHNDPTSRGCTVHAHRPRTCRVYDCRTDPRVWIDFERRIPAPMSSINVLPPKPPPEDFVLLERVRERAAAVDTERDAMRGGFADVAPVRGPKP